jgi:hypothetical protein
MGNLPIINALSINGNVQNNGEKNQINNHFEEYDLSSPNYRVKRTLTNNGPNNGRNFNTTKSVSIGKIKSNGAIPLKSLLKSIGEAISQNQNQTSNNNNMSTFINKMPNNPNNKNSTIRITKK